MGSLLMRGMLAGLIASLLAFGFAKIIGEPQVDRAIAFEELMSKSDQHEHQQAQTANQNTHDHGDEDALVSRDVQASYGLFVALAVFGTALGGLFALAYAFVSGRLLQLPPRSTALLLAGLGFLVFYLVPYLKYPANPPAVGAGETIGFRTQLYFGMIAFSAAALAIAVATGRQFAAKFGSLNATMIGSATYVALAALAAYVLPAVNEVPKAFPADLLWQFRLAAFGTQLILWLAIGLLFGLLIERTGRAYAVR